LTGGMNLDLGQLPERITPYIVMRSLNEDVDIADGSFQLVTAETAQATVEGRLYFRWLPSTTVAFEGSYSGPPIMDLGAEGATLKIDALGLTAPVLVSNATWGPVPMRIRGLLQKHANVARGTTFDRLRFCLVDFPDYLGAPVRYKTDKSQGASHGRLEVVSHRFLCTVDEIEEVSELRKAAARDSGFVISHVGELRPAQGHLCDESAQEALDLHNLFFGFLRGAWSGPVFPQGFVGGQKSWEQFAHWRVDEAREVGTWLPRTDPLALNNLFAGFVERYFDSVWQGPLRAAIHWYVEANSSRARHETKLLLAQVALELLAWVEVVEAHRLHSRGDFKDLSAAGKLRSLLQRLRIPCELPSYLSELHGLQKGDAFDGPGVLVGLRNALVHAGEKRPAKATGVQSWQAGQLALQYVELSLLALCGYHGKYARRGWQGWRSDSEVLVPWATVQPSP
jgi:hypothetical protein